MRHLFVITIMTMYCALTVPPQAHAFLFPSLQDTQRQIKPSPLLHKIAVFGKDSRQPVPHSLTRKMRQIGLLYNSRNSTLCTAFCVAPDIIATASHCLFSKKRTSKNRLSNFIFRLGSHTSHASDTRLSGYKAKQVHHYIIAGTTSLSKSPPIGAALDWSLVRLSQPACQKNFIPVQTKTIAELERASHNNEIFQMAYHQDYKKWRLAYSRSCQIKREFHKLSWPKINRQFKNPDQLILHRCDTGVASSGSPILQKTKQGIVVVGINVGTYQQRNLTMNRGRVIKRSPFHTIANTAVNASAFSKLIPILENADILTDPLDIIELQTNLRNQNYLFGRADGIYGNKTKQAIKSYEKRHLFPESGLPTRKILNALRNVNIIQRGRTSLSSTVVPQR